MDTLEAEMRRLEKVTMEDYTVKKRTVGIGVMTAQEAIQLGAAGPTLRGSGVAQDVRQTEYEAFAELGFTTATAGPVPRSASSKCSSPWKSSARPSATCPIRKST